MHIDTIDEGSLAHFPLKELLSESFGLIRQISPTSDWQIFRV